MIHPKKVIILGSGALKIGQAGEFDYSGSQAIKALKEEGIKVVLVNPNIATIQTSQFLADKVYFLPVTDYFVEKIIEKEMPGAIMLSFGGQTALNCGLKLYNKGLLKKYHVKVLGTPVATVELTEDRDKFSKHLQKIGIPTPKSFIATDTTEALEQAEKIGFPVMVRAGFALGGQGSGIARDDEQLLALASKAFAFSPQILVEQYLHHFKEIEYEVVRDADDNCIAVCNMENMDPLGIHTGESIVVAPSQTLNNFEYHALREASIKIVRSLGIVGECNVQFALNPRLQHQQAGLRGGQAPKNSNLIDYFVIEVNARLSRSSALASKATGYPLAYIAAKLALGYNLTDIKNKVTEVTQTCFEPSLDYIVVKMPRWDIEKFKGADEQIGTSMKSVGEVMGIGRTFEEAFQKAIRMLDLDFEGVTSQKLLRILKSTHELLKNPTPRRMFAISRAMEEGLSIDEIYQLTGIDPWFLYRIRNIVNAEQNLSRTKKLTRPILLELKEIGLSDKRIGELLSTTGLVIREKRKNWKIFPSVFQIDTLSGEFPAKTNYLYMTYNGSHNDIVPTGEKGVIVLGSGPYRIGSSVEFDWTSVTTAIRLPKHNKKAIIVNCNPETVSTDYDISDRLYFEELTFERIADIYEFENPYGVVISVGGQTPNNRAQSLKKQGFHILGTSPKDIERAENRSQFSQLLDDLEIMQPAWNTFTNLEDAEAFCEKVKYPVLLRPSFVLSGTLMRICHNRSDLEHFLKDAVEVSKEYPITVSKFIENAKEIECDAVAQKGEIKAFVISEHIENAGVHSGDATIVLPTKTITDETKNSIEIIAGKLARELHISGPFNIQFLALNHQVQVIEINLRSSRTFPFISKVTGVNLIDLSVDAFFEDEISPVVIPPPMFAAVKVAQFSFSRLTGADPIVHVEMASTGEVGCFGNSVEEAFLKGWLAVGGKIPKKGIFISLGGEENKAKFLSSAKELMKLHLPLYATEKTATFLEKNNIKTEKLFKIHEHKSPNILEIFKQRKVDLVINIVDTHLKKDENDDFTIRRAAIDHNISLFTNIKKAKLITSALTTLSLENLSIKSWDEYIHV